MKIGALIPCYNGEGAVGRVVKGVLTLLSEVIVVDDGSSDGTYNEAKNAGAFVLQHPENLGKGTALKTGFEYIKNKKQWDAVIVLDADGQHNWQEIPKFLNVASKEEVKIVLGNRMDGASNMPWIRWWTNKITSRIISRVTKQEIPDSQCGFRLIKTEVLRNLKLNTQRFDTESEMLIDAASSGYSINSVPIESIYKDERSHIHPVRDTVRFIKLIRRYAGKRRED